MKQKLFTLLLCLSACNPKAPPEPKSPEKKADQDTIAPQSAPSRLVNAANQEDTITPYFDNIYTFFKSGQFQVDSASISLLSGSWYAYAFQDTYKGFQQFGVVFPFEYVIEDSSGIEKPMWFKSINEIATWRCTQNPQINAWGLEHFGSPRRLVWEAYPKMLYGEEKNLDFPSDLESDQAIITYLYPMNRVDYYFRKEKGYWRVFKRVQKKFSAKDLARLSEVSFEAFSLRFISDTPFRMNRIKWPLKNLDSSVGEEESKISYEKREDHYFKKPWVDPLIMAVSQTPKNKFSGSNRMGFRSKDEGGVNFGYVFTKINNHWMLSETWDSSN